MLGKRENGKMVNVMFYLVFAVLMVMAIHGKKNFHVDEIFSYGLSNFSGDGISITIEDGKTYFPANDVWLDYMTVDTEHRFDYENVWEKQSLDVHPPLYYMLLHTICSFFPESFSIWFSGIINILSAMATLFFVRKLAFLLTESEFATQIISLAFICSAGILNAVTFLRMYIFAMFWITAFTYLVAKNIWGGADMQNRSKAVGLQI